MITKSITKKKFNNCEEYAVHQVDRLKNKLYTMLKNDRSLNRKYVDCEINKLFAEISCDSKNHCVCSNGRNGAKGDIGMAGPKGEPGITGGPGMKGDKGDPDVNIVLINNTVFVDTQFGTAAGTRENLNNPVQTLQQALAISLPGDTIYVQPGIYLESNLILIDGVNWFFTEGATLSGSSYLFSDNGSNVNSMIEGYGQYISSGGILNISGMSNITFNGIFVDISGTVPGFIISGNSELTLYVDEIISDTSTVLQITGNTKINWKSQTIDTLGSIIVIDSPASGSGNFIVQSIVGGDMTIDSNRGLFYNNSEFFDLNIISNMITSNSYNHAINVSVPATVINGNNTSIDVQLLKVLGGVIMVNSVLGVSQFDQPKVILNASVILITPTLPNASSIVPFLTDNGNVNIKSSVLYNNGNPSIFVFSSIENSILTVDIDIIILETSNLLQTSSTTNLSSGIIKILSRLILVSSGMLLSNTGNNFVVIDSTAITVNVPTSVSAVVSNVTNGEVTIDSHILTITGNGVPGTVNNLIDHVTGELYMNVDNYVFRGTSVTAIRSRSGEAYLNIKEVSSVSPNTIFYRTSASSYLVSDIINLVSNAIVVDTIITSQGSLRCNISDILINGTGIVLNVVSTAECTGYIGNISTTTGSIITGFSNGIISLIFNKIECTGLSFNTIFILLGNGKVQLKGNSITIANARTVFSVANGRELRLDVQDITCTLGRELFDINTSAGAYLNFMSITFGMIQFFGIFNVNRGFLTITGGNINILPSLVVEPMFTITNIGVLTCNVQNIETPTIFLRGASQNQSTITFNTLKATAPNIPGGSLIIDLVSGEYNIRGLYASLTSIGFPSNRAFIGCRGSAVATINIDKVISDLPIATVSTSTNFWYKTESSIVTSAFGDPVISINTLSALSVYTFSGLLKTNGSDAIFINFGSVNNIIRVIRSTLVSTGRSIHNAGLLPQDIIIVPSVANMMAVNIVQKPPGTLLIDPTVQ